jgi:steroid 5-alpha reductase family enzyme
MLNVFLLIFGLQILFFIYAVIQKTDKVTDLSYGLTFVIASLFTYYLNLENSSLYKVILLTLICIWGIRLAIYLFIRILKTGKDKRFDGVREDFVKFGSFWLLQAISIFVILLPTTYILLYEYDTQLNLISYIGLAISILGIVIETVADYQKYIFKSKEENKGRWISSGIWKYSRHPNYLGEILMWFGVYIYSSVYLYDFAIFTILSPIYITYLLVGVSGIPTLEKQYEKRYQGNEEYKKYKERTGVLFPKIF